MPKLSNRVVQAAMKAGKRVELRDHQLRGPHVLVTPAGAATFYVRYRCAGVQRRYRLGAFGTLTIDQARKRGREALAEVASGGDPAGDRKAQRDAATLADVAERWLSAAVHLKPRTVSGYRSLLDVHILPALGRRKVASLTRIDVERLQRKVGTGRRDRKSIERRGGAKGAVNRAVALLSTVLNAAERYGDRPQGTNPCVGLKPYRSELKERFLNPDERARLDAAFRRAEEASKGEEGYVAHAAVRALRLLSLTGARLSEITTLRWPMVDLGLQCLRLPDSKTGAKVVPLSPQAAKFLVSLRDASGDLEGLVFVAEHGGEVKNMQRSWRKLRAAAQLEGVRIHDLRHSAASDAINAGLSLAQVGGLLGHRSPQTTARYAHLADAAQREAARRMGAAIEAATRDGANVVRIRGRTSAAASVRE